MKKDARALQPILGYEFQDLLLLEFALTHRSAGGTNNERLEFLGDAVLGLVVSARLYALAPQASEGDLSRLRASLVNREALASVANDISLGGYLTLGSGEMKSGGFRRTSILADALEALIGAVYLDGGQAAAEALLGRLLAERIETAVAAGVHKDAKTSLQEFLQKRGSPLPEYYVAGVSGAEHERLFTVDCRAGQPAVSVRGEGRSRRVAEQVAAARMLEALAGD